MEKQIQKTSGGWPRWLWTVSLTLAVFYIYWETGHVLTGHWDQETFLYSYNNAFLKLFQEGGQFPQWNPYLQSGVNLNANMPFPFSLSKLLTLLLGNGVWGHFLSAALFLSVAVACLLGLLKRFQLRPLTCLLVLLLYFEYQLALYSPEALAANCAVVLIYAGLVYVERRKFYLLAFAALYLGLALNSWAPHATFAVFPLQLLLCWFLRKQVDWKRHLTFIFGVWVLGGLLSAPALLAMMAESKISQKVLTYSEAIVSGNFFYDWIEYVYRAFVLRLSPAMILVLTVVVGFPPFVWKRLDDFTKAFLKSAYLFFVLLAGFYFFKESLSALPVLGKIFSAFNPMRPTIVGYLCVAILFGVGLEQLIFTKEPLRFRAGSIGFLVLLFLLFFISFNHQYFVDSNYNLWAKYNLLTALAFLLLLIALLAPAAWLKRSASLLLFVSFAGLWIFTGARYYTRALPQIVNLFRPLPQQQISIFPNETAEAESKLIAFLQNETRRDHSLTAELRDFAVGEDMFQRYPALAIPTIHGWSNFRPLRAHLFYTWLLHDVKTQNPKLFASLWREGGFSYTYGTRYDTELLSLMGVRFLIAAKDSNDSRFQLRLAGDKYQIYENDQAFPRVFLAGEAKIMDNVEEMGNYLANASLDTLRKTAVYWNQDLPPLPPPPPLMGEAKLIRFTPNEVEVALQTKTPAILVLTQSYHPGWQAWLDSQTKLPIYPADYAFLSAVVPAGQHKISFVFRDPNFTKGIYLALCGVILLVILWVGSYRRPMLK